jgi:hypothetical protein
VIAAVEPRTKALAWPSEIPLAATASHTAPVMSRMSASPAVDVDHVGDGSGAEDLLDRVGVEEGDDRPVERPTGRDTR